MVNNGMRTIDHQFLLSIQSIVCSDELFCEGHLVSAAFVSIMKSSLKAGIFVEGWGHFFGFIPAGSDFTGISITGDIGLGCGDRTIKITCG